MKKATLTLAALAALVLSLTGCGNARPADSGAPAAEPQATVDVQPPTEDDEQLAPSEAPKSAAESGRQDGERFETVIMLEGMEETVPYEHIVNKTVGFEMDYEYESLVRHSEGARERFISIWDAFESPENYLEVTASPEDAGTVAAAISEDLSQEYNLLKEPRTLERAGDCIRIEASERKDNGEMADQLQVVYIIPASDGCRVATAHFSVEAAEGFGRRFSDMLNTLSVIDN